MPGLLAEQPTYGPYKYGAELIIDPLVLPDITGPIAVDCETDEQDNFVGLALCCNTERVYYFTKLGRNLKTLLSGSKLIGHQLKADATWLKQWGVNITSDQFLDDTIIMSYVDNSTKADHSLKTLAKEYLNWSWPTYKEMVGMGRTKQTLDKQEIGRVAAYCGMDTLGAFKLRQYFLTHMSPSAKDFYVNIELPILKILFDMERQGVYIDVPYLKDLQKEFNIEYGELLLHIQNLAKVAGYNQWSKHKTPRELVFNPSSPKQIPEVLRKFNIYVKNAQRSSLERFSNIEFVSALLRFKEISKVKSTYIDSILAKPGLPYLHTTLNQVAYRSDESAHGIRTGRLSSSRPNLQNIPSPDKGEMGKIIRRAFIPRPGTILVCADYSQIEYRLLAHFSQEPKLIESYKKGMDVHQMTGDLLGVSRYVGKTLNFASIYGAGVNKIAMTAKVSPDEARLFLAKYWAKLPGVTWWIKHTKEQARNNGGVTTLLGRFIPLPDIDSLDDKLRSYSERAAVNYSIQGSAADIIKLAMIELVKNNFHSILQVHDELLFEIDTEDEDFGLGRLDLLEKHICKIMSNVVDLSVPLEVSIGHGYSWEEAK